MKKREYFHIQAIITVEMLNLLLQRVHLILEAPMPAEVKVEKIHATLDEFLKYESDIFDKYQAIRLNINRAKWILNRLLEELEASA